MTSIVDIVLVEGRDLKPRTDIFPATVPDFFVKFKLGHESHKSKTASSRECTPKWREEHFEMHFCEGIGHILYLKVYERKALIPTLIDRAEVDLNEIPCDIAHKQTITLESGGQLDLVFTLTKPVTKASLVNNTIFYEHTDESGPPEPVNDEQPGWFQTNIGTLSLRVVQAHNIAAQKKDNILCVIELINVHFQTQMLPYADRIEWKEDFTFSVKDINSDLEISVCREKTGSKVPETLGKIAIPLWRIRNGELKWFALKDEKLHCRVHGDVLLEFDLKWNKVLAAVQSFRRPEEKLVVADEKFRRREFMDNFNRVKVIAQKQIETKKKIEAVLNWEEPGKSVIALMSFIVAVYFFQPYMLPIALLAMFIYPHAQGIFKTGSSNSPNADTESYADSDSDDDSGNDQTTPNKQESKTFKENLRQIEATLIAVQCVLGDAADFVERVRNVFTFANPFLSRLAIISLCVATVALYFVPIRYVILFIGVKRFTKRLRHRARRQSSTQSRSPSNNIANFLSRVPCDADIKKFREFRPQAAVNEG